MNLIGADEVADAFGITRRTLQLWAAKGYFPKPTYLGRRAYYSPAQINEFIDQQTRLQNGTITSRL
ncbi:helix-turn-helix transcriptional regulator [Corynebacterium deserti]|uniref:helix-turn-helix transcriptional regulator n=1 Tax=Corynebacterium deserti TaxID=1408191 RepID=UPI0009E752C8